MVKFKDTQGHYHIAWPDKIYATTDGAQKNHTLIRFMDVLVRDAYTDYAVVELDIDKVRSTIEYARNTI
jgi:hypothetical protein